MSERGLFVGALRPGRRLGFQGMRARGLTGWFVVLSALALLPGSALADTVLLDVSDTTSFFIRFYDLPGPGDYRVSLAADRAVFMNVHFDRLYDHDIYLAPPPHEHTESLDGFGSPLFNFAFDQGANLAFFFTVPEVTRTFFTSTSPFLGYPAGTQFYSEDRYLQPRFDFIGYIPFPGVPGNQSGPDMSQTFSYNLSITRLEAAPVPEPSTWVVMLLGIGLVGATLRRRERVAA